MKWNRYYTSPSTFSSFIFGELCYGEPIEITSQLTGIENSYASYVDKENKILSEHVRYSEDSRKGEFGYDYFLDAKKRQEYFDKTLEIIDQTQEYIKRVESLDFTKLSIDVLRDLVNRAEPIYNQSMGYYFLSQPEYTAKLSKVLLLNLKAHVPVEKAQEIFISLVESGKVSCLEYERLDWLENILLPHVQGVNDFELNTAIANHVKKYKYLAASAQAKPWDSDHFYKVLKDEEGMSSDKIKKELHDIKNKEQRISNKKIEVVRQYDVPESLLENINVLSDLGSLRLEAHLRGWQFFQYFGPVMIAKTAELLGLPEEDVFNLTLSEFKDLLSGTLSIDESHRLRRGGNILAITTPEQGEEVLFGEDAKTRYEMEFKEHIENTSEIYGQTVNGTGKLTGEVFVFRWGADDIEKRIYEFPEGKILVAGQTLPLFMPAIRKAAALLTNEGGVLCHAAIVSRELNKPAIIGTKVATELLKDGDIIEMDFDKQKITLLNQ